MKSKLASFVSLLTLHGLGFFIFPQAFAETERKITSINPTQGVVGKEVTITGQGFEEDCGAGRSCVKSVTFGKASAQWDEIVLWTPTQIIAMVPSGATTDEIQIAYYYDENGIDEGGLVAQYTLTGPTFTIFPSVDDVPPAEGPDYNIECKAITDDGDRIIKDVKPRAALPGETVTITGLGFETDCGNGHSCSFGASFDDGGGASNLRREYLVSWSNEKIIMKVPPDAASGVTKVGMYCDSNGTEQGGENLIQYNLEGPVFTVLSPVTQAYGCTFNTVESDASHVRAQPFAAGSETDRYLQSVHTAYSSIWGRVPRCDELQFHLDHSTPLARLEAWLRETPSTPVADKPVSPELATLAGKEAAAVPVDGSETFIFTQNEAITFAGTAEPNATITLYFSSDPFSDITVADASGNWTYTLRKDLGVGEHTVQASATGTSGEESPKSVPLTFRIVASADDSAMEKLANTTAGNYDDKPDMTFVWVFLGAAGVLLLLAFALSKRR